MIHLALCGHSLCSSECLPAALYACAEERGLPKPQLHTYPTALDLLDGVLSPAEDAEPLDLVLCALEPTGSTAFALARELAQAGAFGDGLRMVLCAASAEHAAEAAACGMHGYLLEASSPEEVDRVVGPLLARCEQRKQASAVLHCRDRVRRVAFDTLSYVETAGRDQMVHRTGERDTLVVRCSSRALYSQLEHDSRFFKAGSSFIINLDHVASLALRTGVATMLDGTQALIPVRLRAQLAEALCGRAAAVL